MAENDRVRAVTLNIRHGAPAEKAKKRGDPWKTAEVCGSLKADILALQEVDKRVLRSGWTDMAKLAGKASGMKVVFAKTRWLHGGHYGNALLVRGEIENYEVLEMEGEPRPSGQKASEPRNAILATVRVGDRRISVAATHLSAKRRFASKVQLPIVMDALETYSPGNPRLLLGDLNMTEAEVAANPATSSMVWTQGQMTYRAPDPHEGIDHIAVNGLTIRSVETRLLPISDHLALVADVE